MIFDPRALVARLIADTFIERAKCAAFGIDLPREETPEQRLNEARQAVREAEEVLRKRVEMCRVETEAFTKHQTLRPRRTKRGAAVRAKKGGAA